MPIRDLSDRAGALPTIGELRKAGPKIERVRKNGEKYWSVGEDLGDHFRFTADGPRVESSPWSEQPTTASTPPSIAVTPLLSDLDLI